MKSYPYLNKFKTVLIGATGNSMFPLLKNGDVLEINTRRRAVYKTGEIVLIRQKGRNIIHRLIYINKNKSLIVTKGDNSPVSDGYIRKPQILGKVTGVKRNGVFIDPDQAYLIQSSVYFKEITRVVKNFDKAGIKHVLLKGLPLHLYYEKKHPARIYADSDILIDKNDFRQAEEILEGLGYKRMKSEYTKTFARLKDKETAVVFGKKYKGMHVLFDIHFEPVFLMNQIGRIEGVYPQELLDQMTQDFLESIREVRVEGESFPVLSADNLIIYLALHFFHHNFRGIFRLEFLANAINAESKNLKRGMDKIITLKIRKWNLEGFAYPVFLMLVKYFDAKLPKGLIKGINPGGRREQIGRIIARKARVFDDQGRVEAGKERFMNAFNLSGEPFYNKAQVFLSPAVIYSGLWVGWRRVVNIFSKYRVKRFSYHKDDK